MGEQRVQHEEPAIGVTPQRLPLRIDRQFGGDRRFDPRFNQLQERLARSAAVASRPAGRGSVS